MNTLRFVAFAATVLAAPSALAEMTGKQAAGVFDRIRTTPAEQKLYCEAIGIARDTKPRDAEATKKVNKRMDEIPRLLPGYIDAFTYQSSKARDESYWKTPEGAALQKAQLDLIAVCK
ncbi:hypothetical protein BWI17_02880 [Betaproteobacteria bacterium GR16-43]|nr:hypothetical protein BWI17_02880 [Betaproteobacteria bacterium GR16-43]